MCIRDRSHPGSLRFGGVLCTGGHPTHVGGGAGPGCKDCVPRAPADGEWPTKNTVIPSPFAIRRKKEVTAFTWDTLPGAEVRFGSYSV